MESVTKKNVLEMLGTAQEYKYQLEELLQAVEEAEMQVNTTAQKSVKEIEDTFSQICIAITTALQQRRDQLKSQVVKIQEESLQPLVGCQKLIQQKLASTLVCMEEGKKILQIGGVNSDENAMSFYDKAATLGSLPAVPKLSEVPYISVHFPNTSLSSQLERSAVNYGKVSRMGPVQIVDADKKPGALLVHWEEVETECITDVHEFCLQYAYGDIREKDYLRSNFHDIYCGPNLAHLVRDLLPGASYTFRVCCREEEESDWSAWSLPYIATTNLEHFRWDSTNSEYFLTNEGKIATKVSSEPSLLYSKSAQFYPGHSLEVKVLNAGAGCSDEGIALLDMRTDGDNLLQPGILFVSANGCVFIDGLQKTTRLPPFEKGSKISFMSEAVKGNKIRLHIESNDKTVTYDWRVRSKDCNVYFAVCFGEENWKVAVR